MVHLCSSPQTKTLIPHRSLSTIFARGEESAFDFDTLGRVAGSRGHLSVSGTGMSEKFSATLRIGDLNDFIAPPQACIVSVKGLKPASSARSDKPAVRILPRFFYSIVLLVVDSCSFSVWTSNSSGLESIRNSFSGCVVGIVWNWQYLIYSFIFLDRICLV